MSGTASLEAPPRFCRDCGMALMGSQTTISEGYDTFTGQKLPDREHVTLRCPLGHDVWVRNDNGWVRP